MCSCCCGSKSRFSASADQRQLRLSSPGRLALKASHIQHNQPLQPELHPGQPANDSRPGLTTSNAILLWPIFHTTKPCSQPATHSRAGPPAAPPPLSSWCPPLRGEWIARRFWVALQAIECECSTGASSSSFSSYQPTVATVASTATRHRPPNGAAAAGAHSFHQPGTTLLDLGPRHPPVAMTWQEWARPGSLPPAAEDV